MKNDKKLVDKKKPKILTFREKHGDIRYIIHNEQELHKVCIEKIKQHIKQQYMGYIQPIEPQNKLGFETVEEIQTLPDGEIKDKALECWERYCKKLNIYQDHLNFYNNVKKCLSYEFSYEDSYWERNKAYFLLSSREDDEYEGIILEYPCEI